MPPTSQGEKKKKRKPIGAGGEVQSSPRLAKWRSGISSSAGRILRKRRGHGEGEEGVQLSPEPSSSGPESTPAAKTAPVPVPSSPPSQGFWLWDVLTFRGRITAWWEKPPTRPFARNAHAGLGTTPMLSCPWKPEHRPSWVEPGQCCCSGAGLPEIRHGGRWII